MSLPLSSKSIKDWSLGLFFLSCVVILWVLSSFLLNTIFVSSNAYLKPFFITWVNTAAFSFYLIPYYLEKRSLLKKKNAKSESPITGMSVSGAGDSLVRTISRTLSVSSNLLGNADVNDDGVVDHANVEDDDSAQYEHIPVPDYGSQHSSLDEEALIPPKLPKLSTHQTMQLAFWFSLLWFLSNFLNNSSLIFTSVSSQTILSSTSSLFTIIVGYLFSVEKITFVKLISIALSFIGVVLVTNNDDPSASLTPKQIWLGNLLALAGALCYGVYSILLKLRVKDDSRMDMRLFFGFVGVFNTLLLWPLLLILHFTGLEKFELPGSKEIYFILLLNCFMSFLADYLWARAMLLTSPLTVTVGLSLTIPVAMVLEFVIKRQINSWVYMLGALLICFSFYYINKSEQLDEAENHDS
ncbi:unnamed protein product [Ambrosiozyma monospora]|uniref:Unnamed protein product n=1 Tax=Ambrosiozyma monospora TaxID=43982 RepID=A0A9W7DIL8_AMBMO|nr:unnamed protein product [Ambrosiozyma monospora]